MHFDDRLDFHDPTAGIGGAPPARSALGLRLALASFGAVVLIAATVLFAVFGVPVAVVVIAAVAAVASLVDVAVVGRRLRAER
jgi:hypothetical protein